MQPSIKGGDDLAAFGDFVPAASFTGKVPELNQMERYSDEQLYALVRYITSLRPPHNPNPRDSLAERGEQVFRREGCDQCHTPPLYTNNKLTPAVGFSIPAEHRHKYEILPIVVGTDPGLTMETRRGTGYYKVPSLRGIWYRGAFEHSGSVPTLEDWLDPRRLQENYQPAVDRKAGAVKGHEFGLKLSPQEKTALIAFLLTL
jgi:Di-haem oxidoreductase, putative peroxidase